MSATGRRALVLGAGGHAASGWQIGMALGLADAGIDVRNANLFVGTSAGALVAVALTSGLPLEDLYQREIDGDPSPADAPGEDFDRWRSSFSSAREGPGGATEVLQRFGALGLSTPSGPRADPRTVVASQLAARSWPERDLRVVAVDALSARRRAFDRASGVALIDAVAASCAVPGLRTLVTIQGRPYMDGGVYSIDNADLAAECDSVLVLTLKARLPPIAAVPLQASLQALHARGARVAVVHPDAASEAAFAAAGRNLLDPAVRKGAARAGRDQGAGVSTVEAVASVWPGA